MQPDEAEIVVGDGKTRLYAVSIHSSKRGKSHSETGRFQYFNIGKELNSVSATLHCKPQDHITNSLGLGQERHKLHRGRARGTVRQEPTPTESDCLFTPFWPIIALATHCDCCGH